MWLAWSLGGCLLLSPAPELAGESAPGGDIAVQMATGFSDACVLWGDSRVECSSGEPPAEAWASISGSWTHFCGITESDEALCWRTDDELDGEFESISAGEFFSCAITTSGSLRCAGDNNSGESDPPGGSDWALVDAGHDVACALDDDGEATCWGESYWETQYPPGDETFVDIALASYVGCGITASDGSIVCWGNLDTAEARKPNGRDFVEIESGEAHFCALNDSGAVFCWGDDGDQQSSPPSDDFVAIAAGYSLSCGVTVEEEPKCWGDVNDLPW